MARRIGDWELVEHTAQKMIQHDPSYAGGYFALGWVAEHQGDASEARQKFATGENSGAKPTQTSGRTEAVPQKLSLALALFDSFI